MTDWFGQPMTVRAVTERCDDTPLRRWHLSGDPFRLPETLDQFFHNCLSARLQPVSDLQQVHGFLKHCRYVSDEEQFQRDDVWLHPEEFERVRAGDCEDHALWAWVQLAHLRHKARFVCGMMGGEGHAWVVIYDKGKIEIYEPTSKEDFHLIAAHNAGEYHPQWSVDAELSFYWHTS